MTALAGRHGSRCIVFPSRSFWQTTCSTHVTWCTAAALHFRPPKYFAADCLSPRRPRRGRLGGRIGRLRGILIAIGLYLLHRERNDEAIFFLTALVLAPAAVLSVYHARFLEVRYFFVLLPFVWLLAARALGYALSCPAGRVIVPALVTASVLGNGVHVVTMLRDGRGHYARAVSTMSALTSGQESSSRATRISAIA